MTEQGQREKVISLLERYMEIPNLAGVENYGAKIVDMPAPLITDAIALLKEQEAVKPRMIEFIDKGLTWEKYEVPTCGVCGALLGGALFCPMCGRAVKWE